MLAAEHTLVQRRRGRQRGHFRERRDCRDGLGRNARRHGGRRRGWMLVRSRERAIQRLCRCRSAHLSRPAGPHPKAPPDRARWRAVRLRPARSRSVALTPAGGGGASHAVGAPPIGPPRSSCCLGGRPRAVNNLNKTRRARPSLGSHEATARSDRCRPPRAVLERRRLCRRGRDDGRRRRWQDGRGWKRRRRGRGWERRRRGRGNDRRTRWRDGRASGCFGRNQRHGRERSGRGRDRGRRSDGGDGRCDRDGGCLGRHHRRGRCRRRVGARAVSPAHRAARAEPERRAVAAGAAAAAGPDAVARAARRVRPARSRPPARW